MRSRTSLCMLMHINILDGTVLKWNCACSLETRKRRHGMQDPNEVIYDSLPALQFMSFLQR